MNPIQRSGPILLSKEDVLALDMLNCFDRSSIAHMVDSGLSIDRLMAMDSQSLKPYLARESAIAGAHALTRDLTRFTDIARSKTKIWEGRGIRYVTRWDRAYPQSLIGIESPPLLLFYSGPIERINSLVSIAIVGTRDSSYAGEAMASQTASIFAANGMNIVSGLASGIDTAAHVGALTAGGMTTAVVANVSTIIPKENEGLARRILDNGGLLVAENHPDTSHEGRHLVLRDRIQSGLCVAVLPIETDVKGGTMHTVRFCREQKRLLFCPDVATLPSQYQMNKQAGIRKLLADGWAMPYTLETCDQIIETISRQSR